MYIHIYIYLFIYLFTRTTVFTTNGMEISVLTEIQGSTNAEGTSFGAPSLQSKPQKVRKWAL